MHNATVLGTFGSTKPFQYDLGNTLQEVVDIQLYVTSEFGTIEAKLSSITMIKPRMFVYHWNSIEMEIDISSPEPPPPPHHP